MLLAVYSLAGVAERLRRLPWDRLTRSVPAGFLLVLVVVAAGYLLGAWLCGLPLPVWLAWGLLTEIFAGVWCLHHDGRRVGYLHIAFVALLIGIVLLLFFLCSGLLTYFLALLRKLGYMAAEYRNLSE